jgi:hypothetical protein
MQVLYQRCAAVDIGKDIIAVAVGFPVRTPTIGRPSNGLSKLSMGYSNSPRVG